MKVDKTEKSFCVVCNCSADYTITVNEEMQFRICSECKHELTYELISN
jgi:NMD protein affecting ribosome stability and mRNA decay